MRFTVPVFSAVLYGRGALLDDPFGEYSVCYRRKCTQFHSIDKNMWNSDSAMLEQVQEGICSLQKRSRNSDWSMLSLCKAVTHSKVDAVCCDKSVLSPGRSFMETEEAEAPGSVSRGWYQLLLPVVSSMPMNGC